MKTMKKSAFTLLALMFAISVFSQTVDDGIKFIYYGKTKSAIQALEKVVASKPKDAVSIYWLGQAYLADYRASNYTNQEVFTKAKTLYEQALQGGVNDPWIWVGSGQILLASGGDVNKAKQQFEQAITATKGKKGAENADILNAVGRATAYGDSKHGDPQYGVDVLKRAQAIDPKNPDIDINLGVNYLKLNNGTDAVIAFTDATLRDPKYAAGFWRIGRVYQGQDNKPSMEENYLNAIKADITYAPVYLSYFDYYKDKDVNAAKDYLDSYIANSDKDCNNAYFQADYLFRAGKYQESLAKADSMANGECKTFPRINILYAFNYDRLKDSVKAKDAIAKFFQVVPTENIEPDDYTIAGNIYKKFPGMEDTAIAYLKRALELDTAKVDKIKFQDTIVNIYLKIHNFAAAYKAERDLIALKGTPTKRDIYNEIEITLQDSTLYGSADTLLRTYKTKYPEDAYAFSAAVKLAQKMDTTGAKAVGPEEDYIGFLMKDTVKNGQVIAYYHALIGGYFINFAKNYDSSLSHFADAMRYDAANPQYKKYYDIIKGAKDKADAKKNGTQPANKPPASKPTK